MHAIISYKTIASEFKSLHFYINMLKKDENENNIIIHVNFHLLLTGNNKIFFLFFNWVLVKTLPVMYQKDVKTSAEPCSYLDYLSEKIFRKAKGVKQFVYVKNFCQHTHTSPWVKKCLSLFT